jgi:hypothetical protein
VIGAKKDIHMQEDLHQKTMKLNTAQRRHRIKQKTAQFRQLLDTATLLQTLLLQLMQKVWHNALIRS